MTTVKQYQGFTLEIEYRPDLDAMTAAIRVLLEGAARRKEQATTPAATVQHAG